MELKNKIKKGKKTSSTGRTKNKAFTPKTSIGALFGINKKEVDGLDFQKKVRNEWQ